jgi:hypothetical protein
MVIDDAATILAYRCCTGKRRVHFINLLRDSRLIGEKHTYRPRSRPLGRSWEARDVLPGEESLLHLSTVLGGREQVASRPEVLSNGTVGRQEALGVTRGFKALHAPLPLTRGLVRVLGAVVEVAVLPVFYARHNLLLRSTIALQFIGDKHACLFRRRRTRISSTQPS